MAVNRMLSPGTLSLEEIVAGSDKTRVFILSVQLRKLSFCLATLIPRAALVSAVSET